MLPAIFVQPAMLRPARKIYGNWMVGLAAQQFRFLMSRMPGPRPIFLMPLHLFLVRQVHVCGNASVLSCLHNHSQAGISCCMSPISTKFLGSVRVKGSLPGASDLVPMHSDHVVIWCNDHKPPCPHHAFSWLLSSTCTSKQESVECLLGQHGAVAGLTGLLPWLLPAWHCSLSGGSPALSPSTDEW